MPRHKITFEFEASTGNVQTAGAKQGWSESWYFGDAGQSMGAAQTSAVALSYWRRILLTEGWSLTGIRVAELDAAANLIRRAALYHPAPGDQKGLYTAATDPSRTPIDEQPYDALDISVNTVGGRRRNFLMRGIPNSIITPGGRYSPPSVWLTRFNQWTDSIIAGIEGEGGEAGSIAGLRVRTRVPWAGELDDRGSVLNIYTDGTGDPASSTQQPFVQLNSSYPGLVGQTVVIRNVLGMRGMNGTWLVKKQGSGASAISTGVLLAPKRRHTVVGARTTGGDAQFFTYSIDNVESLFAAFGTSRKTGRPLQLPRGRRSVATL